MVGFTCALLVVALSGCGVNSRSLDVLMESKVASLGDWADRDLVLREVKGKTGILIAPADGLVIETEAEGDVVKLAFSNPTALQRGQSKSSGCAVPITRDGYFLTAAHCLEGAKAALITFASAASGNPIVIKADWRVVWKSPDFRKFDLAIIHAAVPPTQMFVLRSVEGIGAGDAVGLTGYSGMGSVGPPRPSDAAGRILLISEPRGKTPGPVWRLIQHDAPMCPGDSGGPLVDRSGRLIAINSLMRIRRIGQFLHSRSADGLGYMGESVAPDPAWLKRVIEADRRAQVR
ncbi:MAG: S1-C subfamily serine protease [Pseudoalteromonas tetraodonis]|jgi:S1-C subfamily serine protease